MAERSSVFDMIGPVMIGPSSSHTAGVVRIARAAIRVLGGIPDEVDITFYNSFARTYEGHGSDKAIIAGLLDFKTDDKRIKEAFEHAKAKGLKYKFRSVGNAAIYHPNTIKLNMRRNNEEEVEVIGISKGGGLILIEEVNGFTANFTSSLHTLIIFAKDQPGSIAFISDIIAHEEGNIATMSVTRKGKSGQACLVIEIDTGIRTTTKNYMESLSWVEKVIYIPDIDM